MAVAPPRALRGPEKRRLPFRVVNRDGFDTCAEPDNFVAHSAGIASIAANAVNEAADRLTTFGGRDKLP